MGESRSIIRQFWGRARSELESQAFWTGASGLLSGPAMSAWVYIQGIPLPFVVFFGVSMSAATFLLLNQIQIWRFRNNPEGKIHYKNINVRAIRAAKQDDLTAWIMAVGFDLRNSATFPIEYKVTRLWTSIDGRAPKNVVRTNHGGIIEPKDEIYFLDGEVIIGTTKPARYNCDLDYEFVYGRPGDLRFTQKKRVSAVVTIDPEVGITNVLALGVPPVI